MSPPHPPLSSPSSCPVGVCGTCDFTGTRLEWAPAAPKLPGMYEISSLHMFKNLEKLEHAGISGTWPQGVKTYKELLNRLVLQLSEEERAQLSAAAPLHALRAMCDTVERLSAAAAAAEAQSKAAGQATAAKRARFD